MKLDHCNRLSCVQMIEALTKERDEWGYGIRQYPPAVQDYKDMCAELKRVQFDLRVALAETETEKQWRTEAQAQVAELTKDAMRYRWLRDTQEGKTIRILPRQEWDAAIDEATKEQTK